MKLSSNGYRSLNTTAVLVMQTNASERRDTLTELPPLHGSGNSVGSGRGGGRSQPSPRSESLRGRSDLYARLPAVLRTRSGGPQEVLHLRLCCSSHATISWPTLWKQAAAHGWTSFKVMGVKVLWSAGKQV